MKRKSHPPTILSISSVHQLLNLKKPSNPLVSVIDLAEANIEEKEIEQSLTDNFYSIALKKNCDGFRYGQQYYDFNEGIMSFVAPQQVVHIEAGFTKAEGLMLIVHPDFFQHYPLAAKIRSYGQSTQQHIQNKIIERAKAMLSTTDLSVSEIAYSLGFDYPQSFQRLFKNYTKTSPLEYRNSFN